MPAQHVSSNLLRSNPIGHAIAVCPWHPGSHVEAQGLKILVHIAYAESDELLAF